MKTKTKLLLLATAALLMGCITSCALQNVPASQAILNDVTDVINGQPVPLSASANGATGASGTHAQARNQQSNNFWGGAH